MSETKKEKFSLKAFGNAFLETLSACLSPIIPVLISAAMFKTVLALLGPDMLNVITAESDLYVLLSFVGDAGFYFLPVILGYTCAKKFEVEPVMGMFLGAVLIHPTLVEMAGSNGPSASATGLQKAREYFPPPTPQKQKQRFQFIIHIYIKPHARFLIADSDITSLEPYSHCING